MKTEEQETRYLAPRAGRPQLRQNSYVWWIASGFAGTAFRVRVRSIKYIYIYIYIHQYIFSIYIL
jgi:hypothetical protein